MAASRTQQETMGLYRALMEEVKVRIDALNTAFHGKTNLPSPIVREFCYLQLRMLCELIALGCLVAHGDIEATRKGKLHKEYAADKIIDELAKLHPDFYPVPFVQAPSKHAGTDWDLEKVKAGFLTQQELPILYGRCGDALHRGNMKKLLSAKSPIQHTFPDLSGWGQKIANLLNQHSLFLSDGHQNILCQLKAGTAGGGVLVAVAEGTGRLP